jgi:prepilin-type N-terminal cleavage/methylation domain-containing protein/prepilin-type processing-associated H-X9-DG protein
MIQSHPSRRGGRRNAFTLIELLVVIAIIAILAAILFPVFAQAREKARAISCLSNTKQLGLAVMMYVQDYDETYPWAYFWPNDSSGKPMDWQANSYLWSSQRCIQPYIKNKDLYGCPDDSFSKGGWGDITGGTFPTNIQLHGISYMGNAITPSITGSMYGVDKPQGLFSGGVYYGTNDPATTLAAVPAPADMVMLIDGRNDYVTWYGCAPWENDEIDWCYGMGDDIMWNWQFPLMIYATPDQPIYKAWRKHSGSTNVVFADGHSKAVRTGDLDQGKRWLVNALPQ